MKPLVSIILPVYNQEIYLSQTIESVLNQTYENFELIIVDDGSKDGSKDIINDFAFKDKRIITVFISNSGKPKAIDAAVAKANGTLLAFLDHDDIMMPNRLERQVEFLGENQDIHAASSHSYYINEKNETIGKQQYWGLVTKEDSDLARKEKLNIICAFSGMTVYKSSFLAVGGLRSQFWPCDDGDFINRLVEAGYNIVTLQEFLMKYRIHPTQNSSKNEKFFNMAAYASYCGDLRKNGKPEITFVEFKEILNQDSWWNKFKRKMHHVSLGYQQKAGFAYYTKKYINFIYLLSISFILSPTYIYESISKRLKSELNLNKRLT